MTKILDFALKTKGGGRVAHAKSFDPATPKNLERAPVNCHFLLPYIIMNLPIFLTIYNLLG